MKQNFFVPKGYRPSYFYWTCRNSYWLKANKSSLNLTKTNSMIFHPRKIKINAGVPLGTILWSSSSRGHWILRCYYWSLEKLILAPFLKKFSKTMGIIAKASFYLSSKTLLTLHYSPVYPCLIYCNVDWSSICCSNLNYNITKVNRALWLVS